MKYFQKINLTKSISFILTLVTFSFIINFSLISDGHSYIVCATAPAGTTYSSGTDSGKNAEGAILVQDDGSGDITSFALATSPTVFDQGGGQSCDITPDQYKLVFYRIGLCTENPFREPNDTNTNTIKPDLSSCNTIFDDTSGKEVILLPDGEVDLFDKPALIPVGSFNYSYLIVSNHVSVKHTQKFITAADNSPALVKGYHPTSQVKTLDRGTVCYTGQDNSGNPFVDTYSWEIDSSAVGGISSLHGHDLPKSFPGTPKHTRYRCGTINQAAAGLDWATTIVNTIGDRLVQRDSNGNATGFTASNFRNSLGSCETSGILCVINSNLPGVSQSYNLLKTDNSTLATDMDTARRILLIQSNDNPTKISEDTVGFKIRFKTDNAISVRVYQEVDGGGENRDEILHGTKFQTDAIWLDFQTKTRRTRGAWR